MRAVCSHTSHNLARTVSGRNTLSRDPHFHPKEGPHRPPRGDWLSRSQFGHRPLLLEGQPVLRHRPLRGPSYWIRRAEPRRLRKKIRILKPLFLPAGVEASPAHWSLLQSFTFSTVPERSLPARDPLFLSVFSVARLAP